MKEKTEKKEVRKQLLITESLDKRFREHMTEVARERKGIVSFNKYVAELMERAIEGKYQQLKPIEFDGFKTKLEEARKKYVLERI